MDADDCVLCPWRCVSSLPCDSVVLPEQLYMLAARFSYGQRDPHSLIRFGRHDYCYHGCDTAFASFDAYQNDHRSQRLKRRAWGAHDATFRVYKGHF